MQNQPKSSIHYLDEKIQSKTLTNNLKEENKQLIKKIIEEFEIQGKE